MKVIFITLLLLLSWIDVSDPRTTEHYVYRNTDIQYSLRDVKCLTQAIYFEAGNQSQLGKEAVATVVINRVQSPDYPKTICAVVFQSTIKNAKKICQFSFACFDREYPQQKAWRESKIIAERVLQNRYHRAILPKLDQALYFHADYVSPSWKYQKRKIMKIGQHIFYKESL